MQFIISIYFFFFFTALVALILSLIGVYFDQCVQAERWSAPAAAALSTKAGGPKKPKKSSSGSKFGSAFHLTKNTSYNYL